MVKLLASYHQVWKQFALDCPLGLWSVGPLGLDCILMDPVLLQVIVLFLIRVDCLGVPQSGLGLLLLQLSLLFFYR